MKRLISKTAMLAAVAVIFGVLTLTSCASLPSGSRNFNYAERALDRTPENSVVFYGAFYAQGLNGKLAHNTYVQINPKFGLDEQDLIVPFIVSAPCEAGSHYHMTKAWGQWGNHYWNQDIPDNYHEFDIIVPSEPGLYYIGFFDGELSMQEGKYVDYPENAAFCWKGINRQYECLKYVKKHYAGTSWEVLADEEMARLDEIRKK